jgi:hypothetical protein
MQNPLTPPESRCVYDVMWKKYCRAGQSTDNTAHAYCMMDTEGHKHIFRNVQLIFFSTVTMATRTRVNITLYVPRLSRYQLLQS